MVVRPAVTTVLAPALVQWLRLRDFGLTGEPLRHPLPGDALGDELGSGTVALTPFPHGLVRVRLMIGQLEAEGGGPGEQRVVVRSGVCGARRTLTGHTTQTLIHA